METVSITGFRRDAGAIIRKVRQGKCLVLTYRGTPVIRLEPIRARKAERSDPFYAIANLAVSGGPSLTNEEIDQSVL
jgi:prevent-host-death family protein